MTNGESMKDMTHNFSKLDKFAGQDFRRWQKKMHFLLTTLKVVYVLSTPMPEVVEDESLEQTRKRSKWENDDYICRDHIINGLKRSGKSCRLRWVNYLNPFLKKGKMTPQEERLILELHSKWGNRWSRIARKLPGRTDNEIKNYWRTHMRKKAQEKKRAISPSPSLSNSTAYSSITSNNPTVDSMPMRETKERSFYDTGGLEMVTITKDKINNQKMKSTATSINSSTEGPEGYNSMDEIWKDMEFLEDDSIISGGFGTYSEIAPSPMWDYSLWMTDDREEMIGSSIFFPTTSEQFSTELTG